MTARIEEKKYVRMYRGTLISSARILFPVFDGTEKINSFYKELAERIYGFSEVLSDSYEEKFENTERRLRRDFAPLSVKLFSSVVFSDGKTACVEEEYVISEGKSILFYRKFCQVWDAEKEILVPPRRFLSFINSRRLGKNEFSFDGENIIKIENLFPNMAEEGADGRRDIARLSDYVRISRYKIKGQKSKK